jgi:hypothetical protein
MDRAFRFGQKRSVEVFRFVSKGTIEEVMYERQSKLHCPGTQSSLHAVYKQQRARQLNDGTFERRTHKGFEGGQTKSDKGDLFGVHNIFRYNADGFVKGNVSSIVLSNNS